MTKNETGEGIKATIGLINLKIEVEDNAGSEGAPPN